MDLNKKENILALVYKDGEGLLMLLLLLQVMHLLLLFEELLLWCCLDQTKVSLGWV